MERPLKLERDALGEGAQSVNRVADQPTPMGRFKAVAQRLLRVSHTEIRDAEQRRRREEAHHDTGG
jgi:hypothetical protein